MLLIRRLTKKFNNFVAVDDVSLEIREGQTLGLVGESGSGKSTIGKIVFGIHTPTSGEVLFQGKNLFTMSPKERKSLAKEIQMIFQDPFSSLNPRMTVYDIIAEPLLIHKMSFDKKRILEILELVKLPQNALRRFPHEFSGGQRQRIGIARALASSPRLIICDEPISSLDVSIQAQIINLLKDLQKELKLTYLFIAHDLAMIKYISDEIAVMYQGKIVENRETEELFKSPSHPYTQTLLSLC